MKRKSHELENVGLSNMSGKEWFSPEPRDYFIKTTLDQSLEKAAVKSSNQFIRNGAWIFSAWEARLTYL